MVNINNKITQIFFQLYRTYLLPLQSLQTKPKKLQIRLKYPYMDWNDQSKLHNCDCDKPFQGTLKKHTKNKWLNEGHW